MKRLEISRLMDEYMDNEFFPEGGSTADVETVKGWVMAKAAPAEKKRRIPRFARVMLAAALAVGCVLCIAAGLPDMVHHMLCGMISFEQTEEYRLIDFQPDYNPRPVVQENGRLYFVTEHGQIDITDRVDLYTAYICDYSDPKAEITHYLIIGGIPGEYGWLEWFSAPDPFHYDEDDKDAFGGLAGLPVTAYYAKIVGYYPIGERTSGGSGRLNAVYSTLCGINYPWLRTALEELGIGGANNYGELIVGGRLN